MVRIFSIQIKLSHLTIHILLNKVIDFCLARILVTDRSTNISSLRLNWAGRSNCIQRMGRVGRVMDGKCYRFVTRHFYKVDETYTHRYGYDSHE